MADAFFAEGVDVSFTLMGDGNMHFATYLSEKADARTYLVRHEHAALAMASAYSVASGKPGVASVTCGPGVTQLSTALVTATYAKIPVVVFAGESPIDKSWYGQRIEQAPIVTATGAHYIHAHSVVRMQEYVREAFYIARTERRPVVIGVPYDIQLHEFPGREVYRPSTDFIPKLPPLAPHPSQVEELLCLIEAARKPIIIGGRGAVNARSAALARCLADAIDGLLATTLPARGLFDDDPFSLGIAGGYSTALAREQFNECDLIIALGASLNYHTQDGGKLFPNARVAVIDVDPAGIRDSLKTGDLLIRSDAALALEAVLDRLKGNPRERVNRTEQLADRIAREPADSHPFRPSDGLMDPRDAIAELDRVLPKHWVLVNGTGHSAAFSAHMRGRNPGSFVTIREFGAIGNGLCYAAGVAAARPSDTIAVIDGDGSFLMHVQELETIRRHNLRILVCVLNDGAYGPEIHKMRKDGISDAGAVFGRGDLGSVARGFGIRGRVITDVSQFADAVEAFQAHDGAEVWDLHISDQVVSPMMRRAVASRKVLHPL
ncbi:thiamine pyrophosphate-binding protein [Chelativorans composti]|uniref:Thiamine pyrophosphate-binding protein n=1 Tax=Chelativorans composti TaxID=768533 RepID=A0ABW5DH89_9HYPH